MNYLLVFALSAILLLPAGSARAQSYVGIILSGYEKDCSVVHQGSSHRCEDGRQLYVGDVVTQRPSVKTLKIKWAPYFNGLMKGETSITVQAVSAAQVKGSLNPGSIKQYINDFVKPVSYGAVPLVTRGSRRASLQLPQALPMHATLMQAFPLVLSGFREGAAIRSLTVAGQKDEKIYEEAFTGGPVTLMPARMNLKPGERYTVSVNGGAVPERIDVTLMDREGQEEIIRGLANINAEGGTPSEILIGKVAYLQLASDAYPDRIDLYWLGQQLLQESAPRFTKDEEEIVRQLMQRYNQHNR